jgi:dTDP-L-rhamnose 4-epimerase
MRALVTGGAGFIGGHLVDRLLQNGFQVRILDVLDPRVHPNGRPRYVPATADFIEGDVTDREAVAFALRDVDVVFHQAAYQDYMPDFSRFLFVNAVGTALIFEVIVHDRLPVKKVVVASSQAVYGEGQYVCDLHGSFAAPPRTRQRLSEQSWGVHCQDCGQLANPRLLVEEVVNPYNQYAVSKLAEEKAALGLGWLYDIPTVALRYSITQGARQSLFNHYSGICRIFFSQAMRNEPLMIYEDGLQTRDFVHVDDVVDANMLVLSSSSADFQAFNVGSGKRTTVLSYANAVLEKLRSSSPIQIPGEYRRGDNRHSVSSVDKLSRLGWRPRRSFSQILDDFHSWVEGIGGIPASIPDAYNEMRNAGVILASADRSYASKNEKVL